LQHSALPFAQVLPEESIEQTFADAGIHNVSARHHHRRRRWYPAATCYDYHFVGRVLYERQEHG
jgi:hypothetical protein